MRRPSHALPLAAALALACGAGETLIPIPEIETTTFAPSLEIDLSKMTKSATGLYTRDTVVGTGATAEAGKRVTVHYSGYLTNGARFDTSLDRGPFLFVPGRGEVIAGWEEGIPGMKVGGKRTLILPPKLGYGPLDLGAIPPQSILVFTVELLSVG